MAIGSVVERVDGGLKVINLEEVSATERDSVGNKVDGAKRAQLLAGSSCWQAKSGRMQVNNSHLTWFGRGDEAIYRLIDRLTRFQRISLVSPDILAIRRTI